MADCLHMVLFLHRSDSKEVVSSIGETIAIVLDILLSGNEVALGQGREEAVQARVVEAREVRD